MSRTRYWIGAIVVVAALGYLAISGADKNMVTYLSISEVKAQPTRGLSSGVRVKGRVADGSINVVNARELWFTVVEDSDSLKVCYRGVVPDTFKDHAEVVLEGRLEQTGHFTATTLLAKCPSKYEAEEAHPEDVTSS